MNGSSTCLDDQHSDIPALDDLQNIIITYVENYANMQPSKSLKESDC